jgi:segregation and condensation protein B
MPAAGSGPLARDATLALIEAALFVAEEPLPARKLGNVTQIKSIDEVRRQVKRLQALYEQEGTAFEVREIAGGYQLQTRAAFHPWLLRLRPPAPDAKLSPPALETLAVIAYKQPIARADIEAIRGVACGEVLRQLLERDLVRIAGRDTSLGRPVLYGTTKTFLQWLGLNTLEELPPEGQSP